MKFFLILITIFLMDVVNCNHSTSCSSVGFGACQIICASTCADEEMRDDAMAIANDCETLSINST